jgi:hypothetical protein
MYWSSNVNLPSTWWFRVSEALLSKILNDINSIRGEKKIKKPIKLRKPEKKTEKTEPKKKTD